MHIVCLDLEGVLTPEVWINVAQSTGIDDLKITTRDVSDYDVLMKRRLKILKENDINLGDIQEVISGMALLPGAKKFLDWLRSIAQVIILSDTFIEFAQNTFMRKLGYPTLLCHNLKIDPQTNMILDYKLRIDDQKRRTVIALNEMNYDVIAAGDSYNDIAMLKEAKYGILFKPPENVISEFPQFPVVNNYPEFKELISRYFGLTE
ncbi:MAG: bifunctional phosphoserine phosphatase/homoserine phosphotransferase ThrH [Promethearchaeota archaeon]